MAKEDFPRLLREWRTANGVSRKQLSARLGISYDSIVSYEVGRSRPSQRVGKLLAEVLNLEQSDIPCGTHDSHCPLHVLTEEERQFAEQNHDIVILFLKTKRLRFDDWYDTIIFGYLRAVENWFKKSSLHDYSFKTIAFMAMKSSVYNERHKRRLKAVSINAPIWFNEDKTISDELCDPRDCVRT